MIPQTNHVPAQIRQNSINSTIISTVLIVFFSLPVFAQDLPSKIRGYKVQRAEIAVNNSDSTSDFAVSLAFEQPEFASVSIGGLSFRLESRMLVDGQSGTVDFLTFRDFEVNGIRVDIEEYRESFDFEKGKPVELPKPVEINVSSGQALKGAYRELTNSKEKWTVKGRVFVFGKFKKFGFKFKRVVPVDVELVITNPLRKEPSTESNS